MRSLWFLMCVAPKASLSLVVPSTPRGSMLQRWPCERPSMLFSRQPFAVYGASNDSPSISKAAGTAGADVSRILRTPPGGLSKLDLNHTRQMFVALVKEGDPEQAQKLLLRMAHEQSDLIRLTCEDFYQVIQAWDKSGRPEASRAAGILLNDQEDLYHNGMESVMPDAKLMRSVLRLLSSSRERDADRRLWSIFQRVQGDYGIPVDADMYASLVRSLARSKQRDAAERAEKVLREAIELHPPGIDSNGGEVGMTVDSVNVVLTAWAKSGFEYGPKRAEQLLEYMYEIHKHYGENHFTPNVSSFTSLIDAYAQTNEWTGVSQSEQILNRLLDQFLEGEDTLEPNVASWTIVMSAWNRLARKNRRGAEKRADRLLRRMEDLYKEGTSSVAPDAVTYNTVISACSSSRTREGVERAEEILNEMNERYLDGENDLKPKARSLRSIIDAWVRLEDKDAMDRADDILERYEDQMEEFEASLGDDEATIDIYRSMLFGWSKHGNPQRAEEYLEDMLELGMKPDCFYFDRIIDSYTTANMQMSFERSCALFERMEQCSKDGAFQPNERVYTSFIQALTKAKVPGLAKKASLLLSRMDRLYLEGNKGIRPTTFTLNAVLNACAESKSDHDTDPAEAFKLAVDIFATLRTGREKCDHISFGNMLRCAGLVARKDERDSIITSTFQLCCEQGFVNSFVVRDLQEVASEELWRALLQLPEGEVDIGKLPEAWRSAFEQIAVEKAFQQRRPSVRRPSRRR